jgi:HEAT repeat protein
MKMENALTEIMSSKMKHKEQVDILTAVVESDQTALSELFEILKKGTDVQKGTAAEVMKFVSKDKPDMMVPYIDTLIEYINYKAPRVRWGCPEAIGNLASKYPHEVEGAIPKLLENLNDKSTVVRWCAAFALTEIAKYNLEKQAELEVILRDLVTAEGNNGVRNVYIKALKEIGNR